MKLNHRNWVIIDTNGKIINVQGKELLGNFILKPGGVLNILAEHLKTTNGIMQGFTLCLKMWRTIKN